MNNYYPYEVSTTHLTKFISMEYHSYKGIKCSHFKKLFVYNEKLFSFICTKKKNKGIKCSNFKKLFVYNEKLFSFICTKKKKKKMGHWYSINSNNINIMRYAHCGMVCSLHIAYQWIKPGFHCN